MLIQGQRQHLWWRQVSDVREHFEGANKYSKDSNRDQAMYLDFQNTSHSSREASGVRLPLLSFYKMGIFNQANNFI